MSSNRAENPVQVTRSPNGRLTVVLDRGFEPDELLAVLSEAADRSSPAPEDTAPKPAMPRQSARHYPGEFLG